MKITDLQNLDLYTCSLQDINKAHKALGAYLDKLITSGHCNTDNLKASEKYIVAKKLHILISRARLGLSSEGYMISYNTDIDRLQNSKSVL